MIHPFPIPQNTKGMTSFTKEELGVILGLYSMRVAKGEWRDYAIDHQKEIAVFSIFRHSAEHPLYTITKYKGSKTRAIQFEAHHDLKSIKKSSDLREVIEKLDEYKKG